MSGWLLNTPDLVKSKVLHFHLSRVSEGPSGVISLQSWRRSQHLNKEIGSYSNYKHQGQHWRKVHKVEVLYVLNFVINYYELSCC